MTHFFSSSLWRTALSLSIVLLIAPRLFSQCNPDITPPTAVCNQFTTIAVGADGTTTIDASTIDDGSFDDCCLGGFAVRRTVDGPCDADAVADTFASTLTICCADIGQNFTIALRVSDCAGNQTECLTTVEVQDKLKPILQAPANLTVTCEAFDPSLLSYGSATVTDNCCIDTVLVTDNYTQFDDLCNRGTITRVFQAFDCSGNASTLGVATAVQTIVVDYVQDYYVKFPNDIITSVQAPNGAYGDITFFKEDCELMGVSYQDVVFTNQPDCTYKVERTWTVINWCTWDPNLPIITIPNPAPNATVNHPANLPGPIVSEAGTAPPWAATIVKINATDPAATDYSTFWDANANAYQYTQFIKIIDTFFVGVQGKVFSDSSANCGYDNGESLLESWTVRATGQVTGDVKEASTNASGQYHILMNGLDTVINITLVASSNFGLNCQTDYTVNVAVGQTATQDVPVHLEERCGLLSVGIATPRLRRCFANVYTVQAANLSSATIADAYVEVTLDNYFDYTSSSVPGTLVSGNTYKFELGDMAPGATSSFLINFNVSCEAPAGAAHCTEAHIFPYSDCRGNSSWSGADVEVSALCDGDSVRFAISNVGTGDMTQVLDFVVVEDVVMRQEDSFQLGKGETLNFSEPANGSTWRLQAEEEPLHPWGGPQAVTLEGCGGINTTGLVNLFPISNADPFEASDCLENIGAYDPNDKQGIPLGYGSEHYIKANTDLEYMIRFQNTGTDTAFTVVIEDKIAAELDPATVRVQVASHPMDFALLENNVLRFTFNNIQLPDSNVNAVTSNGFVKFRIAQKKDLAEGSRIENQAAIYFDFNDPVLTNTTYHTVGDHFILVNTDSPEQEGLLSAYPNPASEQVYFELKDWTGAGNFELSNNLGQLVSSENFSGKQYRFDRKNLPAGVYHFRILTNNTQIATGKIMLK